MGDRKPLEGVSILAVDDNPDALDLLETTLTYYGALVITASDGREALQRLRRMRVDVVVCDLSMPGFSGHDFIRAVRALPEDAGRDTPAIALTAFDEPTHRQRALEGGFQAFWLKPFEPLALVEEIARLSR